MLSWNLICLSLLAALAQAAVVPVASGSSAASPEPPTSSSVTVPITVVSPTPTSAPGTITTVSSPPTSSPTTPSPTTSSPPTSTPVPTPTSFLLHPNGDTQKCLDVRGDLIENGTPVQIYDCNGTPAQNWVLAGGETAVQLAGTGFCLDAGASPANGVGMKIWECFQDLPAQEWFYTEDLRIALTNQGFCLDLTGGSTADGNQVQIWTCTNDDVNQIWSTSPGGSINGTTTTTGIPTSATGPAAIAN